MNNIRLFFIALKVWLIFAAASIVTSLFVVVFLSVFRGLLMALQNPVSVVMIGVIGFVLYQTGVWTRIKSLKIGSHIATMYRFFWDGLKPIFNFGSDNNSTAPK